METPQRFRMVCLWFVLNHDLWLSLLGNLPCSVAARSNSVHLFCVSDSVPLFQKDVMEDQYIAF